MKDGLFCKWVITKTGHRPTKYKEIVDTLPILCADKNLFWGIDEVILTGHVLVERDFMPTYLNTTRRLNTCHVEIQTVNPRVAADANTGLCPPIVTLLQQTHIFDANLQKDLLSEYKRSSKIKSEEYAKFLADKKALITIISGQCDEATKTKITLRATYATDRQAERLIEFLNWLYAVVLYFFFKRGPFVLIDECQNVCRTWVSKWDNQQYSMDPVTLMYWYRSRIPGGSSYIGLLYLELVRMPVQCARSNPFHRSVVLTVCYSGSWSIYVKDAVDDKGGEWRGGSHYWSMTWCHQVRG